MMLLAQCKQGVDMGMAQIVKESRKIVIPPRATGAEKISISIKAAQYTYVKNKARENDSTVSQVIQAAIDVMAAMDAERDAEIVQTN